MSPLRRAIGFMLPLLVLSGISCSEKQKDVLFDPAVGHPGDWIEDHGPASLDERNNCTDCHGDDQGGGISNVSCFAPSIDGVSCHGSGPGTRHPDGWGAASLHGPQARARPGPSTGFASCKECHGEDYSGGIVELACASCHDLPAPHPRRFRHSRTHRLNAPVCADCHRGRAGKVDCFNNSLCHGERGVHPRDWANSSRHGSEAKKNPGRGAGFAECQECHGRNFTGGEARTSCFRCHGLDAPHPAGGWLGGGSSHRSTGQGNAPICADCHRENAGTPGCFNNTLCHGDANPHPAGWSSGSQHGTAAKAAPGSIMGFDSCRACHGADFTGGTSSTSCFTSCHGWTSAPHDNSWDNGGPSHMSTNDANAPVCGSGGCHSLPVDPGFTVGCTIICHTP